MRLGECGVRVPTPFPLGISLGILPTLIATLPIPESYPGPSIGQDTCCPRMPWWTLWEGAEYGRATSQNHGCATFVECAGTFCAGSEDMCDPQARAEPFAERSPAGASQEYVCGCAPEIACVTTSVFSSCLQERALTSLSILVCVATMSANKQGLFFFLFFF